MLKNVAYVAGFGAHHRTEAEFAKRPVCLAFADQLPLSHSLGFNERYHTALVRLQA